MNAVLYLRQSTYREESISLELQEHEGREFAKRRGYRVVAVEADPGISGRTWNRPAVQRVMSMIDERTADVIVLWKWSRLSRSRLDWAVAADRVQTAGGLIESATEPLDTTTSTGRLARGMLTEFAAFESERIGDTWKESHARRIRNGLPATGKPRFGYTYTHDDGFEIDAVSGPVLAEMYRRYIAGESVYSLVQWLNEGATRPSGGYGVKTDGLWSDRTVRRVMDSGFAAGFISYHGELLPGAHPALVDPEQWETFLEARNRRRGYGRIERSQYLLSGLVRCHCGSSMTAGQFGAQRTPKFRCSAAHQKRTHAGGYVMASVLETAVHAELTLLAAELNKRAAKKIPALQNQKTVPNERVKIEAQIAAVSTRLDNLTLRLVDSGIPHDTYTRLRDGMLADRQRLIDTLRTATVAERVIPFQVVADLLAHWSEFKLEAKREILRSLIDHIEVWPQRPKSLIKVHFVER
ncbi:recombinase family protein [Cryobacterium sp. 10I1]|uniref:recombinase family protein n=1 Tax=Cryobacterium sp. 10I1 TaxID=3048578 RepID=UPI002B22E480|nr:recombinase family protein [Cryobacterium sp. 10I1]MEB0303852.1 recombinase family protein [Cryobacterium sp. 10I1]